jgi:hypothetical protein
MVNPSGTGSPFAVRCDMSGDGGGWTLVGHEASSHPSPASATGVMANLYAENGAASALASGAADGFMGPRFDFSVNYTSARLNWCNPGSPSNLYLMFDTPAELFADGELRTLSTELQLTGFSTNDSYLNGLVATPGDARFCRAATSGRHAGDTSWAVKGLDGNFDCGCNSGGWAGVGAYYGGTAVCDYCGCWGGGWAGSVTDGQQKGGINRFDTHFWVR